MSFCYPALLYPSMMIKDLGTRWLGWAHYLVHQRNPYPVMKHQRTRVYRNLVPVIDDAAFVAPNASLVGNVVLGTNTTLMYHVCIRNYHSAKPTTVGDNTTLLEKVSFMGTCKVGTNCVLGCGTTLDSCTVHENVIIGHHCNIALGATVEQGAIIANGSTVYQDVRVPANELWAGNPAVKICDVTEEQRNTAQSMMHVHQKAGKSHRIAIDEHYAEVPKQYDLKWLHSMCDKMDLHHQSVAFEEEIKVPIEGRRFISPRVHARLPQMHVRVSTTVNRIAPHMHRMPDWVGNA